MEGPRERPLAGADPGHGRSSSEVVRPRLGLRRGLPDRRRRSLEESLEERLLPAELDRGEEPVDHRVGHAELEPGQVDGDLAGKEARELGERKTEDLLEPRQLALDPPGDLGEELPHLRLVEEGPQGALADPVQPESTVAGRDVDEGVAGEVAVDPDGSVVGPGGGRTDRRDEERDQSPHACSTSLTGSYQPGRWSKAHARSPPAASRARRSARRKDASAARKERQLSRTSKRLVSAFHWRSPPFSSYQARQSASGDTRSSSGAIGRNGSRQVVRSRRSE